MSRYAELAAASNFSFLRAASHPEELVTTAAALGLEALGIADRNSVAGVVRAWAAGRRGGGSLKVLAGARLVFADGTPDLICYPQDRAAWGRLTRLLTLGKRRARKGECDLTLGDFLDHAEGQLAVILPPAPGKRANRRAISAGDFSRR
ncbi:MAG: PHP domain-containing protein, partial [Phenylobacterium sp.]